MKVALASLLLLFIATNSLICPQGNIANSLNICIKPRYIEGCNQYLTQTQCKTCDYRYLLQANGLCEIDKETTEECCSLRATDNSCVKCKPGLYLINSRCQQSTILGCLEKDARGICLNCASDFYLKNGVCEKSIKDCEEYTDDTKTICTTCAYGHSLINNFCVENSILGCRREVDHVCKECHKPFFISNGNCEISNCKTYNEYKCVTCNCGYYLTFEGVCKAMDLGCIRYQRGQCTDCLPSYKLKGNKCQIEGCLEMLGLQCKKCSVQYDLVEGGCSMKNCLAWKDGSCEICKSGFNFMLGKCVQNKSVTSQ